jgi:hypothetical protein
MSSSIPAIHPRAFLHSHLHSHPLRVPPTTMFSPPASTLAATQALARHLLHAPPTTTSSPPTLAPDRVHCGTHAVPLVV